MKLSLPKRGLVDYIAAQLHAFFPDGAGKVSAEIDRHIPGALERAEFCFSKVNDKYFFDEAHETLFNHLHADQYAMLLYFLGNTIFRESGDVSVAEKTYYLNRALHGLDVYYEVSLPDIFLFVHPVGTVIGRGKFADYLLIFQRCGIGGNRDVYPTLGEYVTLHPGASVLGNCVVGKNSRLAAGSLLIDRSLEPGSMYFGNPRSFEVKDNAEVSIEWSPR